MRILLLADYYPAYLKAFYEKNSNAGLNYAASLELLLADYFGGFVSYRNHFRKLGHVCELVIGNDFGLQNKWLRENGESLSADSSTKHAVVMRQAAAFGPDVIFIGSMFDYFGAFLKKAAEITPNIFAWIACPYPRDLDFSGIRCVISSVDAFVDEFRAAGLLSERLGAAFDADIAQLVGDLPPTHDVSFIGGLSSRSHGYRVGMLKALVRRGIKVDLWGYGLDRGVFPNPLKRNFHGEVWGMDYYRTLAQSRITLNFHIDVAKNVGFAGNMRTFEGTGCGTLLLTDTSPQLETIFDPESEVATYASGEDLVGKIEYFLQNPAIRDQTARNGQTRCLTDHGYDMRIREFEDILNRHCI